MQGSMQVCKLFAADGDLFHPFFAYIIISEQGGMQ